MKRIAFLDRDGSIDIENHELLWIVQEGGCSLRWYLNEAKQFY